MAHKSGNTSGLPESSSYWFNNTGFPGDLSVTFFNVPPGNKDAVAPNPLTKEESCRVYKCDEKNAYHDQVNAGFSKVCEKFKVRAMESLKYFQEFYTLLLWRHFHTLKHDTKRNKL